MRKICSLLLRGLPFLPVMLLVLWPGPLSAEYINSIYREGDWVALTDFRMVNSLDLDRRVLYAGTSGGIERYNFVDRKWETPLTVTDGLPHPHVLVVAFDPVRGDLWCGTREGLAVYNTDLKSWRIYGRSQGLGGDEVREIVIGAGENSGFVYVNASGSWSRFRKGSDYSERVSSGSVPRNGQSRWQGPIDQSLFSSDRYPFLNRKTDPDEHLRTFPITALREDDWGSLWVGTAGGNIYSVSLISHTWTRHRFGLISNSVTAIEKGKGSIWFGGAEVLMQGGGGITRMSSGMSEWEYFEEEYIRELGRGVIYDLVVIDETLWIAASTGLVAYDFEKNNWKRYRRRDGLPDDHVLCLGGSGSRLWVGTRTGLVRLDTDSLRFDTVYGIPPTTEVHAVQHCEGRVWVGTDIGLFSAHEESLQVTSAVSYGGLLTADIRDLAYHDGELFIAASSGLYRYDLSDAGMVRDPYPGPLTGFGVRSIAVDSLNIWAGTDTGVERYMRDLDRWISYRPGNFELLSSPVTDILIDDDHVWFASPDGAVRFSWNEPYRAR